MLLQYSINLDYVFSLLGICVGLMHVGSCGGKASKHRRVDEGKACQISY